MATLTTKLEAVNTMLGYITEAPVNSIADSSSLPPSAAIAKDILDEVSRDVQSQGWHFNTAEDYKLEANVSGEFVLPDNTMTVDAVDTSVDVVQRGTRLFDRTNQTFVFEKDSVKVNITFLLDFEDLPERARRYISIKAARALSNRLVGSREIEALILRDEVFAKASFEDEEFDASDRTIFKNYDAYSRIGINRNTNIS